jgi:hypothetical protein
VAVHERAQLRFARTSGTESVLRPQLVKDTLLRFDTDCAYGAHGLIGLARAADPAALPGYNNGVSVTQAFALDTTVVVTGHVCR